MPVIRIKPETYERMKNWAVPLEDTANDAIERILDMAEEHRACLAGTDAAEGTSATQDEHPSPA